MKKIRRIKAAESVKLPKNRFIIYLSFLVVIPFTLYFKTIHFDFSRFDDKDIILANYDTISDFSNVKEAFTHDAFMSQTAYSFYRPAQTISFMIDAQIGGQQPWIYHLSNLILHILTVIALFYFLIKIGLKETTAFILSVLFSIHPLLTNAVAWIPARGDLLLTLFSLLSIITFLEYFEARKFIIILLHGFIFLLAIFSKETAILLPLLILLYYYFVKRNIFKLKEAAPFLIVWSFSLLIFYFLRKSVIKANPAEDLFGFVSFIRNLPAIPILFGKFFIPLNLSTLPLFDTVSIVIGIIILIAFTILTIRSIDGKINLAVWGSLWFLAFLIPPMLFRTNIASIGFEYYEYRGYLPLIGIIVILGILVDNLTRSFSFNKIIYAVLPVILVYGIIAFIHSGDFAGPVPFFTSAIEANSNNVLALDLRGCEYLHNGNIKQSLADFENAIKICPSYSHAHFNEGVLYHYTHDDKKSEFCFTQALKYEPAPGFDLLFNLGWERIALNKYSDAIIVFKRAESEYPPDASVYNNLGLAYFSTCRYDSAIYYYSKAIYLQPNSGETLYHRGLAYSLLHMQPEAENDLAEAHKLGYK